MNPAMSGSPSKKQNPRKRKIDNNDAEQSVSNKRVRKDFTPKSNEYLLLKKERQLMKELNYVNLDISKAITDQRKYCYVQLNNQLRVLVVSDSECQMANVHLMVKCGFINDPVDLPKPENNNDLVEEDKQPDINAPVHLPGLAHYLEHMIYLTKTNDHSRTNSLHRYLEKHGGHFNAVTYDESTNYSFRVLSDYLSDAMDRFSDAIVDPTFDSNLLRQEVNAIDTEFEHEFKFKEASNIWYALSKDYTKRPIYRGFGCGNKKYLYTKPKKDNVDVKREMKKLYNERYMSSNMCLVVIGKETLQELAEIVVKSKFGAMLMKDPPSDVLQQPVIAQTKREAFICLQFDSEYKLQIQWNVRYSRFYPVKYINTLMRHKGPKGLLAKLMERDWAIDSHADFYDLNTDSTIYYLDIILTSQGVTDYLEVVRIIFSYINFLQEKQSHDKLYKYCQGMAEKEFVNNHNRRDYAEFLCGRLWDVWIHEFHVEDIFKEDTFISEGANIMHFLVRLNPDNCRIIVSGYDFLHLLNTADPKGFTQDELYPMQYLIRYIDNDVINEWKDVGNASSIEMPDVSTYYPSGSYAKPELAEGSSLVPELVHKDSLCRVWYMQDNPELPAFVSFRLSVTPAPAITEVETLSNQIFHDRWEQLLYPLIYITEFGGLKCKVKNKDDFFEIHVEGYPHHINECVNNIMQKMLEVLDLTPHEFHSLRDMDYQWKGEVDTESHFHFIEWARKMLSSVQQLEFLVCGHIIKNDAITLCKEVACVFKNQREKYPYIEHTEDNDYDFTDDHVPTSSRYYSKENKEFQFGDKQQIIAEFDCTDAFEEFGDPILDIFSLICKTECFDYLRTERQLAYCVEMYPEKSKLVIMVGAIGRHDQVQLEIEHFLMNDVKNIMDGLTPETLNEYTKSAGKTSEVTPQNQSEAHTKNWTRLFTSTLADFDQNHFKIHLEKDEKYINDLHKLTPGKLKSFYEKYIHPDGEFLKYYINGDFLEYDDDKSEYKKRCPDTV